jgi:hypothetical protein
LETQAQTDNQTSPPQPSSTWKATAIAAIGLLVVVVGIAGYLFLARAPVPTGNPKQTASLPPQTEAAFVAHYENASVDPEVLAEWREARGDHKMIAYVIGNCDKFRNAFGDIDVMPRRLFSAR